MIPQHILYHTLLPQGNPLAIACPACPACPERGRRERSRREPSRREVIVLPDLPASHVLLLQIAHTCPAAANQVGPGPHYLPATHRQSPGRVCTNRQVSRSHPSPRIRRPGRTRTGRRSFGASSCPRDARRRSLPLPASCWGRCGTCSPIKSPTAMRSI
jgi:hypothetical protein